VLEAHEVEPLREQVEAALQEVDREQLLGEGVRAGAREGAPDRSDAHLEGLLQQELGAELQGDRRGGHGLLDRLGRLLRDLLHDLAAFFLAHGCEDLIRSHRLSSGPVRPRACPL
jgi:hypothetical protein